MRFARIFASILTAGCCSLAGADEPSHVLMRFPTLHGNTIVFAAHDNLWAVARTGGTAVRLTSEPAAT
jgi:tricorn protease-like protein